MLQQLRIQIITCSRSRQNSSSNTPLTRTISNSWQKKLEISSKRRKNTSTSLLSPHRHRPVGAQPERHLICSPCRQSYADRHAVLRLVLETLKPLPDDRKCFRMINGVLVERTVKDVIPALQTNSDGLRKVLDELVKQYKRQQDEMEKWKVRSNFNPGFYLDHAMSQHAIFGNLTDPCERIEKEQRANCPAVVMLSCFPNLTFRNSHGIAATAAQKADPSVHEKRPVRHVDRSLRGGPCARS